MSHTPGPWNCYGEIIVATSEEATEGYAPVAEANGYWFPRAAAANARLIAAAPGLLAACRALLAVVEPNSDLEDSRTNRAIQQAEAVIAKVKGDEP